MNHEPRSPRRDLLPQLPLEFSNHIARVEYTVFTKADCALAWKIFSDLSRWPRFCSLYSDLQWHGTPWTPGSRMRLEIREPINVTVDRVLTVCMPPHHVAWINHVRGYTMEQWVSFEPYQGGATRVSTWIEVTGAELSAKKGEDIRFLKDVVEGWFDKFSEECDHVVDFDKLASGDSLSSDDGLR
jgi:hypothetical protein